MNRLTSILLIFFLLAGVISTRGQELLQLGFNLPEGKKRVKIPFELHNNLIVIPVEINKVLPLNFILDTGVRTAILTEKTLADMIAVDYSRKIQFYGAGGENLVEAYIANQIDIDMPGVSGKGHSILVLDEDYLQLQNFIGTPVHGILGYEVFSRFIVEIRYSNNVLILHEPRHFKPGKGLYSIPIQIEDTKPLVIGSIREDGKYIPVRLMMDTGASHSLMLFRETSEFIDVPEKNLNSSLGRGLAGRIDGQIARLDQIILGGFEMDDVIATFPDTSSYYDEKIMSYRNGTIGGGIINRFDITFDFFNEQILIKPNKEFKEPFDYNLAGMVVKATGVGLSEFEVVEVREGSPAYQAGIRPRDKILSVNNKGLDELDLAFINDVLTSKEDKIVEMGIKRDDLTYLVRFKLVRQI